ncbi:MAG: glycosyltransferase family 2 protein [bacterium]|nr:glycosyltransferase family 2 protein [bacterium]
MTIQNSKLSVHLLTRDGAKYLPYLFASLREQTFQDWQLFILDNASTDKTVEAIKKELESFDRPWQLAENKENVGFARGHNQLFNTNYQLPITNYALLLNQDVILAPDYLEKLVELMDANPQTGAAQGTLFRWDFEKLEKTDTIDTLGLCVLKNRRVIDQMAGVKIPLSPPFPKGKNKENFLPFAKGELERDFVKKKYKIPTEIFGVSGALPMYRRQALEDVKINNEVFDEDFVSYKEDVDLAYRLRSAGWRAYLAPQARAWHDRSSTPARDKRGELINYYSYRNHLLVLLKNEYSANFLKDLSWIFWYELKKFVYLLFFERGTLKGWKDIWRLWPKMRCKRAIIKAKRKLSAHKIRQWFN